MTALELADAIDNVGPKNSKWDQAAAMLRAQHEAIKVLREVLDHAKDYAPIDGYAFTSAKAALAATENIAND